MHIIGNLENQHLLLLLIGHWPLLGNMNNCFTNIIYYILLGNLNHDKQRR